MRVLAWPYSNRRGNPYTHLLYGALQEFDVEVDEFHPQRVLTGTHDVWHMHWPDGAFNRDAWLWAWTGTVGLRTLLRIARARSIRLIWTAHNTGSHETRHPRLETRTWRDLTRQLDGYISLSRSGQEKLEREYPALRRCPSFVIPHGHYRDAYPDDVTPEEARDALSLAPSSPVVLYFGHIRPYKNVPHLIHSFRGLDTEAQLVVAGKPQTDFLREKVYAAAQGASGVHLHLDFIPKEEVQLFFRAADGVVLPYTEILNSGSALLALSFDRPVLVPEKGAMGELQDEVGPEWVKTYRGSLTPNHLRDALSWARTRDRSSRPPLEAFEWKTIARQTLKAYQRLL